MRRINLYLALKYKGNYQKINEAIKRKEQVDLNIAESLERKLKCKYVTILDSNYPRYLRSITTPPLILFYYGDLSLLYRNNMVSIIGKRENSSYGKEMTEKIVKGLQDYHATIISGMALGIDSIAHNKALECNLKTIAVLGGGIDYCYPQSNKELYERIKKEGLIISEYPGDVVPEPHNFLIRNRIIAGLSESIVVIEANYKSGTMNTVAYGLEFGKDIFAVPGLANCNSGCNYLIKQGAQLIETASDLYE